MQDANGATASTTLSITITGGVDPPYINTSILHPFSSPPGAGDLAFINGFSYQDIDTAGDVTVTIASVHGGDELSATSAGGVVVSGAGSSSLTLTGTMAAINAFVAGNNVRWDPAGNSADDRLFNLTIDDNGALPGGIVMSNVVLYHHVELEFSNSKSDDADLAGYGINRINIDLGQSSASDSIVTAWSHGPANDTVRYDGGGGSDDVTIVFTPAQLEEILGDTSDRARLQDYLDGDVSGPSGDDTLSLGTTSWQGTVAEFETASLALATGTDGFVRFTAVGDNIPDFEATPSGGNGTSVGTTGADTISALDGNDILVGRSGDDTLNGDTGSDMLLGGSGNDTLRGGFGNDIVAGGTGADRFSFATAGAPNSDEIVDFSFVDGDTIDLSALLDPAFSTGQPISSFVRALQPGSDIVLQVDTDGGANSFVDVATLTSYGTTSPDILRVTFEGSDHVLLV
jgi:Ca2+-binding RTX toxin-like protein